MDDVQRHSGLLADVGHLRAELTKAKTGKTRFVKWLVGLRGKTRNRDLQCPLCLHPFPVPALYASGPPSDESDNINDDNAIDYEEPDSASAAESEVGKDDHSADEYHPSDFNSSSDSNEDCDPNDD
ncbi:hypothetical protein PI125_g12212 [Phytophthora idaei]|nr:hypothetical protein PI125_g12212 [Phytophthora idaei]